MHYSPSIDSHTLAASVGRRMRLGTLVLTTDRIALWLVQTFHQVYQREGSHQWPG
jgi:hypothetical protein